MSDPSIVIDPPSILGGQTIGIHHRLGKVEEVSLKENTNQGREENIDRCLLPPLAESYSDSHKRSKISMRSKQSHKRRRRRLTSSSSSCFTHSVNDSGRYKRTRQSPQVVKLPATLQPAGAINETPISQTDNVCSSLQKTQVLSQNRKSGLLIGLSMRCSDFYPRSYTLNLLRNKLLLSHFQESST